MEQNCFFCDCDNGTEKGRERARERNYGKLIFLLFNCMNVIVYYYSIKSYQHFEE